MLVSVAIVTYNHEKFICQTLDSVLSQETNFDLEIIIGKDCSTDNTRKICTEYKTKYPDKIKLLTKKTNIGFRQNNINTWTACAGKYIAPCEGDDYWTDSHKLQKQIDVLENNPQYSACFHRVEVLEETKGEKTYFTPYSVSQPFGFDLLLERWISHTYSLVFRNIFVSTQYNTMREQMLSSHYFWSDRLLETFVSNLGNFYYINETMAIFRRHHTNYTKIGNRAMQYYEGAKAFELMRNIFFDKKNILSEQVVRWSLLAAEVEFENKKYKLFLKYFFYALIRAKTKLG